jgi:hypothetical protein
MGNQKVNWDKADWKKQDIVLAKEYGVSREAVRQARLRHGQKALTPWKRTCNTVGSILKEVDTSDKTLTELAPIVNCQERRVSEVLKGMGKDFKHKPRGGAIYDWTKFPEDWMCKTDKELAVIIGVKDPAIVGQWRIRHGYRKQAKKYAKLMNVISLADQVLHTDSTNEFSEQFELKLDYKVRSQVCKKVLNQVDDKLLVQIVDKLYVQIMDQVESKLRVEFTNEHNTTTN